MYFQTNSLANWKLCNLPRKHRTEDRWGSYNQYFINLLLYDAHSLDINLPIEVVTLQGLFERSFGYAPFSLRRCGPWQSKSLGAPNGDTAKTQRTIIWMKSFSLWALESMAKQITRRNEWQARRSQDSSNHVWQGNTCDHFSSLSQPLKSPHVKLTNSWGFFYKNPWCLQSSHWESPWEWEWKNRVAVDLRPNNCTSPSLIFESNATLLAPCWNRFDERSIFLMMAELHLVLWMDFWWAWSCSRRTVDLTTRGSSLLWQDCDSSKLTQIIKLHREQFYWSGAMEAHAGLMVVARRARRCGW